MRKFLIGLNDGRKIPSSNLFSYFFQRDINEPTIKKSAKSAVFLMHFLWLLYVTNSQVRVKDKTKKSSDFQFFFTEVN